MQAGIRLLFVNVEQLVNQRLTLLRGKLLFAELAQRQQQRPANGNIRLCLQPPNQRLRVAAQGTDALTARKAEAR